MLPRLLRRAIPLLLTAVISLAARGEDGSAGGQTWTTETLANGLRVIYAPMPTSPATHVRVIYHVGSRDERQDRQGFAHMFEHMMFRGSAHVAPEEHMKLIGLVGGSSNAFTSFDETVYVNTLPSSCTEMALWLEADRMSSFRVSPAIFSVERMVVGQEWRRRLDQPYGGMFEQLLPELFKKHPYQWTPIGDMANLQQAKSAELQAFFQKYYVPNNAILVIAGNIDIAKTKEQVKKYYAWIPGQALTVGNAGLSNSIPARVDRNITPEPAQTEPRRLEVKMTAPLARVILAYHMPPAANEDIGALGLLLSIVGDGQSSRLSRSMVTTNDPIAVGADSFMETLEDGGVMGVMATILDGKKPDDAEKLLKQAIADAKSKPVTAEELEKVKQQQRAGMARHFETAESTASLLGGEMLTHNTLKRVETERQRLEAITPADLLRVAQKYFPDNGTNIMVITPGTPDKPPAGAPVPNAQPVEAATTQPVAAPEVRFPADYPVKPPMTGTLPAATFEKGTETTLAIAGASSPIEVVVMEDHRMPIINWTLALRAGGHADPVGKEGIGNLTSDMVRRGPKGKTFDQFNEELESRAISLGVNDNGDNTRVSGSCLKEQFQFALAQTKSMLATPAFDEGEFQRLKNQSLSSLNLALNNPGTVASRKLTQVIYGDTPLGRLTTPESLRGLTLEDVKKFYAGTYHIDGAVLVISGDISVADGQAAAKTLLEGLPTGSLPKADYTLPPAPTASKVYLVDLPQARQSSLRLGIPAYSIQSDEKFTGTLINQILSGGLDSRLLKYVRTEKGYIYSGSGIFSPNRHAGAFVGNTDTRFDATADTITAMYKVFTDMKSQNVTAPELADAKFRVSGQLLMAMQTIDDQADRRLEGILNGYPADYYDKYAARIAEVSADQIKAVMNKYVQQDKMIVVVVSQAGVVKEQLEKLGVPVEVVPAPKPKGE
jgi:zinc protease